MIKEKFNLKDEVALITGSGRGIREGLAESLAEFGAKTIIADINLESAKKTALKIKSKYHIDSIPLYVDVRSSDSIKKMIDNIIEYFVVLRIELLLVFL